MERQCAACGAPFAIERKRGRPRLFCYGCRPSIDLGLPVAPTFRVTCERCGIEFSGKGGRRFCSIPCANKQEAPRKGRICDVCGSRYDATCSDQRTCSRPCGVALRVSATRHSTCNGCGSSIQQGGAGLLRKWCSAKCREAHRPKPDPVVRYKDCVHCGAAYAKKTRRLYCSVDCCRAATNVARRADSKPCRTCGAGAPLDWPRRQCDSCALASRRRARRRRRAREAGAVSEPYTLSYIAARDGHRCGLCHRKVNMRASVPHPNAPTIDHIVPLARGGDDTRVNVHLAHFICNSVKSDRGGGEQLALFG